LNNTIRRDGDLLLSWLNSNLSLPTLLWLFPITFLLHDFEEIIFVESWFKKNYTVLIESLPKHLKKMFEKLSKSTSGSFAVPVFIQLILYIISTYLAVEKQFYAMFVGFNVLLFLHIFTHVGQWLFFKVYTLGAGTALLITLPYSIYLFYRLLNERIITPFDLLINIPYGIVTILVVFVGHLVAPKIVS
jgi:hypothetical protein